jgi:hypothetical protein
MFFVTYMRASKEMELCRRLMALTISVPILATARTSLRRHDLIVFFLGICNAHGMDA